MTTSVTASEATPNSVAVWIRSNLPLLVLVLVPFGHRLIGRSVLSRSEVFLILIMGLVAGAVPRMV